eukprot:UN2696
MSSVRSPSAGQEPQRGALAFFTRPALLARASLRRPWLLSRVQALVLDALQGFELELSLGLTARSRSPGDHP